MPQQPRRFQADSLDDAYDQVRTALGDEAVILATRRATAPSLYGRPPRTFVEVLAHVPEASNVPSPVLRSGNAPAGATAILEGDEPDLAPPFENPLAGSGDVSPELMARVTDTPQPLPPPPAARVPAEPPEPAAPTAQPMPADPTEDIASDLAEAAATHGRQRDEFEQLLGEIGEMRGMVEQLAVERINGRIDESPAPLRWLRNRLREQGLKNTLAATILDQAADAHVSSANADSLRRTVERQLAMMLPPAVHLDLAKRPAFVALVGPAGAGKTTFAMKMALEIERAYSLRVIVAGTDVERAGAPQQFTAVGAAAGVQTRLCYTPGELRALIAEDIADVVLVDTPGHDGLRRDRMTELQTFIHASRSRDVLLVLPATMKTADLEALARAYEPVDPLGVVLTRCDNTSSLGEPFSALVSSRLGLAYTTHLDAVSDAPRPGDNLALTRAIMTGDWDEQLAARGRAA